MPSMRRRLKGKIGPEADFPYMMGHVSAMLESTRFLTAHGFRERIDFIFDTASEREQHVVLQAWHFWRSTEWMKERQALMGDPPVFSDDKVVLPLQAADFYAWHARKERQMLSEGRSYEHPSWEALSAIRGAERDWTFANLRIISGWPSCIVTKTSGDRGLTKRTRSEGAVSASPSDRLWRLKEVQLPEETFSPSLSTFP